MWWDSLVRCVGASVEWVILERSSWSLLEAMMTRREGVRCCCGGGVESDQWLGQGELTKACRANAKQGPRGALVKYSKKFLI